MVLVDGSRGGEGSDPYVFLSLDLLVVELGNGVGDGGARGLLVLKPLRVLVTGGIAGVTGRPLRGA